MINFSRVFSLLLAVSVLFPFSATAQAYDCAADSVVKLSNQTQVDAFNCAVVANDLTVQITGINGVGTAISDLSKLSTLTTVGGQLTIQIETGLASAMSQLGNFDNVTQVGGLFVEITGSSAVDMADLGAFLPNLNNIGPCTGGSPCSSSRGTMLVLKGPEITRLPNVWSQAGAVGDQADLGQLILELPKVLGTEVASKIPVPIFSVDLRALDGLALADLYTQVDRLTANASAAVTLQDLAALNRPPTALAAEKLTFTNMAGLDDLTVFGNGANYPNLDQITFQIVPALPSTQLSKLTNLAALNALTFRSMPISDINGVAGIPLTFIDLYSLPNVTNVDALATTTSLKSISIQKTGVTNLDGLRGVSGTIETVQVLNNTALADITGLAGITGATGPVIVSGNTQLAECDVLEKNSLNPRAAYYVSILDPAGCRAFSNAYLQVVDKVARKTTMDFGSLLSTDGPVTRIFEFSNVRGSFSSFVEVDTAAISAAGFSLGTNSCTGPLQGGLTPGKCEIEVTLNPAASATGPLSSDVAGDYSVGRRLFSSSTGPYASPVQAVVDTIADPIAPGTTLDFAQVELQDSSTKILTLSNSGTVTLDIVSMNVTDVTGGRFTKLATTCGTTLVANASCTVSIVFAPTALGGAAGTFTLTTTQKGSETVNLTGNGVTAAAPIVNPVTINFGDVTVGTQKRESFTVTNAGVINSLTLGQLAVSAPYSVQTDNCSLTTLPAGASCAVEVELNPSVAGPVNRSLSVPATGGAASTFVSLVGNALEPASLSADQTHLDFGLAPAGSTQTVTFTNIGAAGQSTTISSVGFVDLKPGVQYSVSSDTCTGNTLASQATCSVAVVYSPNQEGVTKGALRVAYGAGKILKVAVSGRSTASDSVNPQSLSFGDVEVGTTSATQQVTFENTGSLDVTVSDVRSDDAVFVVSNNTCAGVVAPSGTCSFDVAFQAISQGHLSSFIEIVSSSSHSPDQVLVDGFGRTPPQVHLSEPALAFAQISSGGQGASEVVTVTNYGDEDLIISAVTLGAVTTNSAQPSMKSLPGGSVSASASVFSIDTNSCTGATLSAGSSCSFRVVYSPASSSPVSTTITISSNAVPAPTTLSVTAAGVAVSVPPVPVPALPILPLGVLAALLGLSGAAGVRRRSI